MKKPKDSPRMPENARETPSALEDRVSLVVGVMDHIRAAEDALMTLGKAFDSATEALKILSLPLWVKVGAKVITAYGVGTITTVTGDFVTVELPTQFVDLTIDEIEEYHG